MLLRQFLGAQGYMQEAESGGSSGGGGNDRGDDTALLDDDAEDGEDTAAAAKAAAAKVAAADKSIPKARFDEAVKKERERADKAEAELRRQAGTTDAAAKAEAAEKELDDLEDALDQAIKDGDDVRKKELRARLRAKTKEAATATAKAEASYATAVAVEQVRYDARVASLEALHPEMNPDHESYDKDLTDELIELKGAYEATGMGSTDALAKAAKYVFKEAAKAAKAEAEAEGPTDAEKKELAEKAARLKEEAIKRGLKAKGQQPPADSDKVGKASDKRGGGLEKNVSKMTDKDFKDLPDDEKARLRGDAL